MREDTIWAIASPPGSAARGVLRVSGPDALAAVARVGVDVARARAAIDVAVEVLPGRTVDALVLVMPGPRSFTGEDVVELHLPGSPLLLERVGGALEPAARPAAPGEFTRRAFENGRLSLSQAEAVLDLIHADDLEDLRRATAALGGAVRDAVAAIRARIDDARALLEAGLDFDDGETGAVDTGSWLPFLIDARGRLARLIDEVPRARPGGDVLLLGAANAGKSSLCNALAAREVVLVSARAGTTRDVIAVPLDGGVRLLDAPGDVDAASGVDALALRGRDRAPAAAAMLVVDPTAERVVVPDAGSLPVVALVWTRGGPAGSAGSGGAPEFVVDSASGRGIDVLRTFLQRRATVGPSGRGERLGRALEQAHSALLRALEGSGAGVPEPRLQEELIAVELGDAIAALDAVDGASTPEDLLDRIFARFCLGK